MINEQDTPSHNKDPQFPRFGESTAPAGPQPDISLETKSFQPSLRSIATEVSSAPATLDTLYGGVSVRSVIRHLFEHKDIFSMSLGALSDKNFKRELTKRIIVQVPELKREYDQMKAVAKPDGFLETVLYKFGLLDTTKTERNFLDSRTDVCKALDALLELGLVTHSFEVLTHVGIERLGDLRFTSQIADCRLTAEGMALKAELLINH